MTSDVWEMPALQKLAGPMKGRVTFTKVDTDKYPQLASQFHVEALPTLVLFKGGQAVARLEGLLGEDALRSWLDQHLDGAGCPSS